MQLAEARVFSMTSAQGKESLIKRWMDLFAHRVQTRGDVGSARDGAQAAVDFGKGADTA
jgi:hypothetical protein